MNYHTIETASIGNGTGFRVVLWVAGCEHNCPGCQNPETHDYNGGQYFSLEALSKLYQALDHEWVSGLTLSGGDPLAPGNVEDISRIVRATRVRFPNKTIWLYTGNRLEMSDFTYVNPGFNVTYEEYVRSILENVDVVVDGPFVESEKDISLAFRGSRNQRLIDCKATIREGRIVELEL